VIVSDRVDDHKIGQIVFIRSVISMPSHHVVGTVILNSLEEMTAVFVDHSVLDIQIFEPGARRLKIPGIGQPVCT
jgi:hypothetical protein